MTAIESVATLGGALVIALIILIKVVRGNLQGTRLNYDIDLLASAQNRTHSRKDFEVLKQKLKSGDIKKKTSNSAAFFVQVIFGVVVFAGFSVWAYHLWQGAFKELAAVSAVIALLGLIMPFFDSSGIKERNSRLAQIDAGLKSIESKLSEQPAKAQASFQPEKKVFQQPERTSEEKIPEDSILRRHYLAHKAAEIEARVNPYPTDSVLRRHYETMLKTGFEAAVQKLTPAIKIEAQPIEQPEEVLYKIPEDSVLKRHFLNQLRAEIEASLFPRPTDSVLMRHYETLLDSELESRVARLN